MSPSPRCAGTSDELGDLAPDTVTTLEGHQFPMLQRLYWRNSDLDFASIRALRQTLARPPERAGLVRSHEADDELALRALEGDGEVARRASSRRRVALLWE